MLGFIDLACSYMLDHVLTLRCILIGVALLLASACGVVILVALGEMCSRRGITIPPHKVSNG